jgi:membrane fusion protein (multidrug efflux system)
MMFKKLYTYIAAASLLALMSCGDNQQGMQGFPPVQVAVHQVTTSDAKYFDEYPAIVRAFQEVELRAQVNGYITGIHFTEGDRVKKGQKLYTIDQQQSEAAYQQAQANLAVQEANLERARKDVERYRELDKNDAIAKQQVDYAESAYTAALKQVEAARATVRSVQTNVRYTTIVAPFDGTIGISQVRLGASVTPGQTLLNTISTDEPMAVDISVDQSQISKFSQLMSQGKNSRNDSTFMLNFKGETYPHPGKLTIIDRAVDPQTGTIRMRLLFPNPQHGLRPGMSGSLQVWSESHDAVVIPYKAVAEQLGEFFVYMVDSAKATQRKVILGKQVGKNIVIHDGLKAGEVIITEGIQNLREGSPIAIPAEQPAAKTTAKH